MKTHTHIHSPKLLDLVQSKPPIISTLNYPTATATHQQQQFLVCQFEASLFHMLLHLKSMRHSG
ncbi:hypothetical protein GBAR_LOCUS22931 [Geodia barretti]|uniref:Uncharacterized protein n=1 Tax=Geodia barretti TaxID=519541 RepID=A0AA35X228_GEOBA|nr:hypothetical protein GBAR_LOCUS22931 [Geodia barretti]